MKYELCQISKSKAKFLTMFNCSVKPYASLLCWHGICIRPMVKTDRHQFRILDLGKLVLNENEIWIMPDLDISKSTAKFLSMFNCSVKPYASLLCWHGICIRVIVKTDRHQFRIPDLGKLVLNENEIWIMPDLDISKSTAKFLSMFNCSVKPYASLLCWHGICIRVIVKTDRHQFLIPDLGKLVLNEWNMRDVGIEASSKSTVTLLLKFNCGLECYVIFVW